MAHFEKKKKGHLLYDGKVVKLNVDEVELEDGSSAMREYIRHSGGSTVIAETEDGILFVEQFRYPYGRVVLELPAGKRDGEEDPMLTARRELEEETGYYAKRLTAEIEKHEAELIEKRQLRYGNKKRKGNK